MGTTRVGRARTVQVQSIGPLERVWTSRAVMAARWRARRVLPVLVVPPVVFVATLLADALGLEGIAVLLAAVLLVVWLLATGASTERN